jgi:hypothetical protein
MEYEETNLQTETEQHNQAQKLFRREWEYKAIGDKEQQTMTSIGVRLLQRIVSLGVCSAIVLWSPDYELVRQQRADCLELDC